MFQAPSPYPGQHNLDDATVFNMTHVSPTAHGRVQRSEVQRSEVQRSEVQQNATGSAMPGLTKNESQMFNMLRMKAMTAQLQRGSGGSSPDLPFSDPSMNASLATSSSQAADLERQLQLLQILARLVGFGGSANPNFISNSNPNSNSNSMPTQLNTASLPASSTTAVPLAALQLPLALYLLLALVFVMCVVLVVLVVVVAKKGRGGRKVVRPAAYSRQRRSTPLRRKRPSDEEWLSTLTNSVRS